LKKETFTPSVPHFKERILEKLEKQYFMHHTGIQLVRIEPGYVDALLSTAQHHRQQNEFVHGGVIATIADIAMGFAAFSLVPANKGVVTSKLDIAYLRPAKNGKLIAKATVIKQGNLLYYCEAEIIMQHEKEEILVARGYATMCTIDN
jgi:uncharacterized protein (TIGR00369 family)